MASHVWLSLSVPLTRGVLLDARADRHTFSSVQQLAIDSPTTTITTTIAFVTATISATTTTNTTTTTTTTHHHHHHSPTTTTTTTTTTTAHNSLTTTTTTIITTTTNTTTTTTTTTTATHPPPPPPPLTCRPPPQTLAHHRPTHPLTFRLGGEDYTIFRVKVRSPDFAVAPNTDGLDIAAKRVHIVGADVINGDDSICMKAPAQDVLVEDSVVRQVREADGVGSPSRQ
jgi:hypothetical protein